MSIARDIMDRVFYPDRDVHPIPVLDGGFTPNLRLEQGRVLCDIESPDSLVREAAGSFLVSSLDRILRIAADGGGSEVVAETGGTAGALALGENGEVYVAVAGRGVVAYAPTAARSPPSGAGGAAAQLRNRAGGRPRWRFLSPTVPPQRPGLWLQDLMQKHSPTGRLIACNGELGEPCTLPRSSPGLWASLSRRMAGRSVSRGMGPPAGCLSRDRGAERVLVKNFAGYPARISPAGRAASGWPSSACGRSSPNSCCAKGLLQAMMPRCPRSSGSDRAGWPLRLPRTDADRPYQEARHPEALGAGAVLRPGRPSGRHGAARESLHSRVRAGSMASPMPSNPRPALFRVQGPQLSGRSPRETTNDRRRRKRERLCASRGSKVYGGLHAIDGVDFDLRPARSMLCSARTGRASRRCARRSPARSLSPRALLSGEASRSRRPGKRSKPASRWSTRSRASCPR